MEVKFQLRACNKSKKTGMMPLEMRVLLPKARAIWEKYNWKLPVLSNQKYNSYLQEIGNICGIDKQLHSHLARHTFATIMLNRGVPMVMISRMLGHTSTKITESTYAELLTKTIVDTVNRLNL